MAKKKNQKDQPQLKLHFAINDHVKKLGLYYVSFSLLKVLENFNDREDYGTGEEMAELAESLYEIGPRVPLKGYKDGDSYVVIQGHRRFRAAQMVKDKHGVDLLFPLMVYPPGTSKKDMLLDTLLTNSGKDLTPLEKASTVSKLIAEKVPVKEIANSLGGVSQVYIKNLERLWGIPDAAKKLIRDGVVAATLVMSVLKNKNANLDEFIQEVEKQASLDDQTGGNGKAKKKRQARVTAKNVSGKDSGKIKSLKEFTRFRKQHEGTFENKAKEAAYEFMCGLQDGKVSYLQIVEFFTGK